MLKMDPDDVRELLRREPEAVFGGQLLGENLHRLASRKVRGEAVSRKLEARFRRTTAQRLRGGLQRVHAVAACSSGKCHCAQMFALCRRQCRRLQQRFDIAASTAAGGTVWSRPDARACQSLTMQQRTGQYCRLRAAEDRCRAS